MTELIEILLAAFHQNNWSVWAAHKADHNPAKEVPNGVIMFDRGHSPSGDPARSFGTADYNDRRHEGHGIGFASGHYDLTLEEAREDFIKRSLR